MTNVHIQLACSLNESTLARACNAHHGNEDFSLIHDDIGIPEPLSVILYSSQRKFCHGICMRKLQRQITKIAFPEHLGI
jgi:hypothetical protein